MEKVRANASSSDPIMPAEESSQKGSPWSLERFQDLMQAVRPQWQVYEDTLVHKVKDQVLVAYEHPVETCAVAVGVGLLLLRGPRRILYRNTLGRFKTEEKRLTEAELHLRDINESISKLKKQSKNILTKISFGEEDLQRGSTKIRAAGHEIQRLSKYIYKVESQATDLMEDLRAVPGRKALELRAELASMTSGLKSQRHELNQRVTQISELGIRV
ncbi:RGS1-HXK1-interacting protein 1-like isoform X1 [Zingiber officinale]|uniref:RGS1-HXK1-interacting protein 1-like isoform X1 n=1 Tax=Zingiber officinale TaxID=94328 RepID=UPI001C4D7818|nr:RGS1-HXK1-interacting protein 1-like isoform X1 [Zingiber officinale]